MHKKKSYTANNLVDLGSQILSCSKVLYFKFLHSTLFSALLEKRLGMTQLYQDTDSSSFCITDLCDSDCRMAVKTGTRFPLPMWLPSEKELEEKKAALKEGLASNWGEDAEMQAPNAIDPRDPNQFEFRVYSAFRSIKEHLDVRKAKLMLDPIFSVGTSEKYQAQLWQDKDKNRKKLNTFSFELGKITNFYKFA